MLSNTLIRDQLERSLSIIFYIHLSILFSQTTQQICHFSGPHLCLEIGWSDRHVEFDGIHIFARTLSGCRSFEVPGRKHVERMVSQVAKKMLTTHKGELLTVGRFCEKDLLHDADKHQDFPVQIDIFWSS